MLDDYYFIKNSYFYSSRQIDEISKQFNSDNLDYGGQNPIDNLVKSMMWANFLSAGNVDFKLKGIIRDKTDEQLKLNTIEQKIDFIENNLEDFVNWVKYFKMDKERKAFTIDNEGRYKYLNNDLTKFYNNCENVKEVVESLVELINGYFKDCNISVIGFNKSENDIKKLEELVKKVCPIFSKLFKKSKEESLSELQSWREGLPNEETASKSIDHLVNAYNEIRDNYKKRLNDPKKDYISNVSAFWSCNSNDFVDTLTYFYILEKNKNDCLFEWFHRSSNNEYRNVRTAIEKGELITEMGLKYEGGKFQTLEINGEQLVDKIVEKFVKCKENNKLLCVPLNLFSKGGGHRNMLIYNQYTQKIERFEPHGNRTGMNGIKNLDKSIENKLLNPFNKILKTKYNYKKEDLFEYENPTDICPRIDKNLFDEGFQSYEGSYSSSIKSHNGYNIYSVNNMNFKEQGGFCCCWSYFYMDSRIKFPKIPAKELTTKLMEGISKRKETEKLGYADKTMERGKELRNFILGYLKFVIPEIMRILEINRKDFLKLYEVKGTGKKDSDIKKIGFGTFRAEIMKLNMKINKHINNIFLNSSSIL